MKPVQRARAHVLAVVILLMMGGVATVAWAVPADGRIMGTMKDQSGGVMSDGRVQAVPLVSGPTKLAVTDQRGHYTIDGLPAGRYRLTASAAGFDPAVRDEVVVVADGDAVADFVLTIARQESSVVVTAPASIGDPLLVTTDPRAPRQPVPAHDGADYLKTIPASAWSARAAPTATRSFAACQDRA